MFIDEIDKIARAPRNDAVPMSRAKACSAICCRWSKACTVKTKYGTVKTDHILFIASGAFHMSKPSDLIPEAAGPPADPGRARAAGRRGLRAHPDRAGRLALTEQYAALLAHRGREAGIRRRRRPPAGRSRLSRSTNAPRTSARGACTPSWSGCWKPCPSTPRTAVAPRVLVNRDYVESNLGELVADQDSVAVHPLVRQLEKSRRLD